MYILSADFGTSSVKLAILDHNLGVVSGKKVEYAYEVIDKHKIHIDPEVIYNAFIEGVNEFGDYIKKVEVLSMCMLTPSLIAMDKMGKSLYPAILHLDRRSYKQSKFALNAVGKQNFLNINGNLPFAGGISLTSMLWIKDNYPEIYKSTYKFGHFNTYIHRKLTGKWVMDPSNASFTGLYETLQNGTWSKSICSALGIDIGKLPDIVPSISVIGRLGRETSLVTGLKEGIPIIMGANDTTSAAYGAGAVKSGDILNISGSSEIVTITTSNPQPNEKYCIRCSAENGKWLILAITVSGFALDWFRKEFYREVDRDEFYDVFLGNLLNNYEKSVSVKFTPYLAGDRHSLIKKKASFSGLTFDTSREDMLMGLLVGTLEPLVNTLKTCEGFMKLKRDIFLTGGLVSEDYLAFKRRLFKKYDFKMVKECSTIGNGKIALKALGGDKK